MTKEELKSKYYRGKYYIVFYDKTDEELVYLFDNPREICKQLGWEVNRRNVNTVNVNLFRALKRPDHTTHLFRGKCYRVYIFELDEETTF